ncbi:MAG: hypothetical protein LBT84_02520 [Spirochaetia bacterium]|jgi:hypothetical protein|nr:hypothetical protein [Spirochaetia bacterium]
MKTLKETDLTYERAGLAHRIKDISIMALFTIIVALISALVMDLLVYPISAFALSETRKFSLIIKYGFLLAVALALIFMVVRRIHNHLRKGLTLRETLIDLAKAPASAAALVFFMIVISVIVIGAVYILLSANNRMINFFMSS